MIYVARGNAKNSKVERGGTPVLPQKVRLWGGGMWAVAAVLLAAATAVRIWAAVDEFWMDEIWSLLGFAGPESSPRQIMTAHHDNNHYLVTLWMYALGPLQRYWILYRLPALVAGIGTICASALLARRWGSAAAFATVLLTSSSYMLIVYASEARGYSLAGFFALTAFLALDRSLTSWSPWAIALFVVSSILGTLSHLTFVEVYAALFGWSCWRLWSTTQNWGSFLARLMQLHIVPVLMMAALYIVDVRYLKIGGGALQESLANVVATTMSLILGNPFPARVATWVSATVALVIAVAGLVMLKRERSDVWLFFLLCVFVAPALVLAIRRPEQLYERYFYLNAQFWLVLCSYVIGRLWSFGVAARAGVVAAMLLFLLGNGWSTYNFLRVGRGHFREALDYMAAQSEGRDITIGDNGKVNRNVVYLEFYTRHLPGNHHIEVLMWSPEMPVEPEWMISNSQEPDFRPPAVRYPRPGQSAYILQNVYRHAGLSGIHFAIYRRADATDDSEPADP